MTSAAKSTEVEESSSSKDLDYDNNNHSSSSRITYSNQAKLPHLPLPKLEDTLDRFKAAVRPLLQTEAQKEAMETVVAEFGANEGPKLQELLEKYNDECRSEQTPFESYIEEFWTDSYLSYDDSVVLNLNPFFLLEDGPDPLTAGDQKRRAASLVFASLKFASCLQNETLPPDIFRGVPLCMDQFKAIFGSCRTPMETDDVVEHYEDVTHVVVMVRHQMYYFQGLWPDGKVAVDMDDIYHILCAIEEDAVNRDNLEVYSQKAIGVLTTKKRSSWYVSKSAIENESESNKLSMKVVDSALFVLVLDDFMPTDIHESASNILHGHYCLAESKLEDSIKHGKYYQVGSCCNRWYDKMQLIVCKDGSAGINFEHSAIDGHTALRWASDIYAETIIGFAQSITKTIHGAPAVPGFMEAPVKRARDRNTEEHLDTRPKHLKFDIPDKVLDDIFYSETALGDALCAMDTKVLQYNNFGKSFIVSNRMSPDSFVQVCMVLAYYRLYGEVVCSYESVLTKRFLHGRTEAMRSTTELVAEFCEIFCSRKSKVSDKVEALRAAVKDHSRLVKEAACGAGVDRHLFGLRKICEKNDLPIPEFFSSESWLKLNHTVISTSNCGNPSLRLFGFGPVSPDGFGIGYIIKDNCINFTVASKHRQTIRYCSSLSDCLSDIANMMGPSEPVECVSEPSQSKWIFDFANKKKRDSRPSPRRKQLHRKGSFLSNVNVRETPVLDSFAQVGTSLHNVLEDLRS